MKTVWPSWESWGNWSTTMSLEKTAWPLDLRKYHVWETVLRVVDVHEIDLSYSPCDSSLSFIIPEISVKLIISYSGIYAGMWEIKENGQYEDKGVKTGEVIFHLPQMLLWTIPQGRTISTKNNDILWVKMAGDKDSNNSRGAWSWLSVEWNHVIVSEMTEKISEGC